MKFKNKCSVLLFSIISFVTTAQNITNPWSVTFGINAIDTRVSAGGNINIIDNRVSQPFSVTKNWNVFPSGFIGLDRAINRDFSIGFEGSFNTISKFVTFDGNGYVTTNPGNLKYYGLDAALKYSFKNIINSNVIDPNITLGGGYALFGPNGITSLNMGLRLNIWISKTVAINTGTTYKLSSITGAERQTSLVNPLKPNYLQHTFGLTYRFGGVDSDNDGVSDKEDACPTIKGLKQFKGCPDSDEDGLIDSEDKCPKIKGSVLLRGCPDTDDDGIIDIEDNCPTEKGTKVMKGCPDEDRDGIIDKEDKCPYEKGPIENSGCPWQDTDKDGVLDKDDKCPTVSGPASNNGCPEKKIVSKEVVKKLNDYAKTILFDSGKSSFLIQTLPVLESITNILKEYPDAKFSIEGHTDSDGSNESNLLLSQSRANAVKLFLIQSGIASNRLTSIGYGETKPIATNKTASGKSLNRRTEVLLID